MNSEGVIFIEECGYLRPMSRVVPLALITLLLSSCLPMVTATNGRAVNVDLDVTDISITYPDSTNQSLYQMFSSN